MALSLLHLGRLACHLLPAGQDQLAVAGLQLNGSARASSQLGRQPRGAGAREGIQHCLGICHHQRYGHSLTEAGGDISRAVKRSSWRKAERWPIR